MRKSSGVSNVPEIKRTSINVCTRVDDEYNDDDDDADTDGKGQMFEKCTEWLNV